MLRKPPRPTKHKDRPVSLPPVFRGAKLEEVPQGNSAVFGRTYSEDSESPSLVHANKENRPIDRGDGRDGNNGSGDSGLESDVSLTGKMSTGDTVIPCSWGGGLG